MKKAIYLALSLLLILPVYASSGIKVPASTGASRKVNNIYYAFAYNAVPQGNNVYAVTIFFLKVDQTLFTYSYVNAPTNIIISMNLGSGPVSFTFPSGANSLNVGNFTFSSPPTQAIPITTNPSSIDGLSISTLLTDINIM
jgi:hypothetical protein